MGVDHGELAVLVDVDPDVLHGLLAVVVDADVDGKILSVAVYLHVNAVLITNLSHKIEKMQQYF